MSAKHADFLFDLDQDPEVMRYINGGTPTTRDEIRTKYLPRLEAYSDIEKGWGMWGVTEIESSEYLGWILVRPINFFNEARDDADLELGWRFRKSAWGKGFATEAALNVMAALELSGVQKFTALALPQNVASIKVMKKLGMKFVESCLHKDPLGDAEVVYYSRVVEDE